jgi:hypothetical protein
MTTFNIPALNPLLTRNPQPANPGLESKIGDVPEIRWITASKKVDDISRHESKHDADPKHGPNLNAREKRPETSKPDSSQPQGGKPLPGNAKK